MQRSAEALLLAEAVGKPFLVQDARVLYIHDLLENGRAEDAAAQIEAYRTLAGQTPSPVYEWVAGYLAATRALLAGQLAESEQLALWALAKGAVLAPEQAAAIFAMQLATVKAHQGHLGEMVGGLELLLQRYPEHPSGHAVLANAYCEIGRMDDARVAVDKAIASGLASGVLRSSLIPYAIASLAPACAALGDARRAASLYETLLPWSGMHLVSSPAVAYIGPVNGFLGIFARTAGMWPRAQQLFESAIEDCTRMQSRSMLARTKFEYAHGLLRHGTRRAALEMLDDAARLADELGLAGLLKWIGESRNG